MAPLLKAGSDLLEQGLDLARRREYDRARGKFDDAARKYAKEGNLHEANLARAYAALMLYPAQFSNPGYLTGLAALLRSLMETTELRPGPRGISAPELAAQVELAAAEVNTLGLMESGAGDRAAIAQGAQAIAGQYRQLGSQPLFLPETFHQISIPADSRFPMLMALSFETLGRAFEATDPLLAAENFQTAQQYWTQTGDAARAGASAARVERLAYRAKCWFCGREGIGHGIQFVSMPIDLDVTGLQGTGPSPLPSLDSSGRRLFACRGCHAAIRGLADSLAEQRSAEVEARLLARIQNLEARLRTVAALRG